jgi:Zn-dependent peptidase ImmA (M78 family)
MQWLEALKECDQSPGLKLPEAVQEGMGVVRWTSRDGQRKITIKRRFVPSEKSAQALICRFWDLHSGMFRERLGGALPLEPDSSIAAALLGAMKAWFNDHARPEDLDRELQGKTLNFQVSSIDEFLETQSHRIFGDKATLALQVEPNTWSFWVDEKNLCRSLDTECKSKSDKLSSHDLESVITWLAEHWAEIFFNAAPRPAFLNDISDHMAASFAYKVGRLKLRNQSKQAELEGWRASHAFRAASDRLPNIFLERQGDELLISWDDSPAEPLYYLIHYGTRAIPINYAMGLFRDLIHWSRDQLRLGNLSRDCDLAGEQLASRTWGVELEWLEGLGFQDSEATNFAQTGFSRHPVAGLLRSGRDLNIGSGLRSDIEDIMALLKPVEGHSFRALNELASGLDTTIDPSFPWESGYVLARTIRHSLKLSSTTPLDIEQLLKSLNVSIFEIALTTEFIRGVAIGSPRYAPATFINTRCPDALGPSGRRTTLAHELCHLLFDRSRMRGLAQFEGSNRQPDRLIEMRANAFAIELLLPMNRHFEQLFGLGKAEIDHALKVISQEQSLSLEAVQQHYENYFNRLNAQ